MALETLRRESRLQKKASKENFLFGVRLSLHVKALQLIYKYILISQQIFFYFLCSRYLLDQLLMGIKEGMRHKVFSLVRETVYFPHLVYCFLIA